MSAGTCTFALAVQRMVGNEISAIAILSADLCQLLWQEVVQPMQCAVVHQEIKMNQSTSY